MSGIEEEVGEEIVEEEEKAEERENQKLRLR